MPTNITDSSAFTDPIQGPADADPQAAASYNLGFQGLANRTRWLANLIGGVTGVAEWIYPSPRTRTIHLSALPIVSGRNSIVGTTVTPGVMADGGWLAREIVTFGPPDTLTATGRIFTSTAGLYGIRDLTPHVPSGALITAVRAYVDPGTAQATADDRIQFALTKRSASAYVAPTVIASGTADATGNAQEIALTGLGEVVSKSSNIYELRVRSSAGAASVLDEIAGFSITFSDPGPRNF